MTAESTKTVLVTGGAGYIGSHCCKALGPAGYSPVVYDNLSTGHRDFVKWGPLVEGDVRDGVTLLEALNQHRPVAVMHFAALALVGDSVSHPGKYWDVNVGGTLALLEAMRRANVDKLVFSSTCAVYGEPEIVPISEDIPKNPVNPYGASKLAAERMMDDFDQAHGLKSVRLRYFNAAGADPAQEIGEDRAIETHLIPLILDAALERRPSIAIFGQDYPTPDGTAIRDYIHVTDLAAAHVAAINYLIDGGATAALNVGTGRGASVAEVIATAKRAVAHDIRTTREPRRAGDPACLVADPRKTEQLLDWRPVRSGLDAIMADAWAWHLLRFGTQMAPQRASSTSVASGARWKE
jgi:UDP-glucose-4-epimerase GalE